MAHEPLPPAGAAEQSLDLDVLALRFVEQRHPGVAVPEVRALFEQLMDTVFAGATITQYLPVLLWRCAMDRWPARDVTRHAMAGR